MNIGILYICIGKYNIFWEDFYKSCEEHFFPNCNKEYFVFTDEEQIFDHDKCNVTLIKSADLGWPYNTLMRYRMFFSIKDKCVLKADYFFFFNANAKFVIDISDEILPNKDTNFLVSALHPGFINKPVEEYPYERNEKSHAYIAKNEGKYYYQGCFFGGKILEFFTLVETCMCNVDLDLEKSLIAIWHDESHLNRYFALVPPKTLAPSYIYPEDFPLPGYSAKILMRDKAKYGGHNFLRNVKEKWTLKSMIKRIYTKILI